MSSKKPSGAEFRKRRNLQSEENKKLANTLNSWMTNSSKRNIDAVQSAPLNEEESLTTSVILKNKLPLNFANDECG